MCVIDPSLVFGVQAASSDKDGAAEQPELIVTMSSVTLSSEHFYPNVVITALMRILKDPTKVQTRSAFLLLFILKECKLGLSVSVVSVLLYQLHG